MQRRYQDKELFDNLLLFRTEIKLLLEAYERNVTIYANKTQKIINKMKPENNHGLKRVFRATGFSMKGLMSAWKNEAAFRQETVLACIMLPIVLLINISTPERILLIMTVLIVLIVELLNSAIEAVVDRIGDEIHPLSGQAKDIASAAVFISLVLCALTWSIIIWPLLF
jgi:diacylglycerol kinase (ATP)